jgi:hypothetical protein
LFAPPACVPSPPIALFQQIQRDRTRGDLMKKGQPSFAEKIFLELGTKHNWEFVFSKDGSKFSPEYLAEFDAVIF